MTSQAPVRELGVLVGVVHGLTSWYLDKGYLRLLPPGRKRLALEVAVGLARERPEVRALLDEHVEAPLRLKLLAMIDQASRQARTLASELGQAVPHPEHEQSAVVMFLAKCRGAANGGRPLPLSQAAVDVVGRLWTLADAIGEDLDIGLAAEPRRGARSRTAQRKPAITQGQLARGLLAIEQGTHTSTRAVANLIHASQSAVARHPIIREALMSRRREPRHRRSARRERGREASEDDR